MAASHLQAVPEPALAPVLPLDLPELRKARGAFFTPAPIADFLAAWAVGDDPAARILDPSCGDGVFLRAAARQLKELGAPPSSLDEHVYGVDLHRPSLKAATAVLEAEGLDARLVADDFFNLSTPAQLGCLLPGDGRGHRQPAVCALPGTRRRPQAGPAAPWRKGSACRGWPPRGPRSWCTPPVSSSLMGGSRWCSRPSCCPRYAEPIRRWLKRRFRAVNLVMFERLQFAEATERVVLVIARGSGGTKAFTLIPVEDAEDLPKIRLSSMHLNVVPADDGKWTDFLLPVEQRQLLDRVVEDHFVPLGAYGAPMLGTVTGANGFFASQTGLESSTSIDPRHLRDSPPGTKHLQGPDVHASQLGAAAQAGEAVWLLNPASAATGTMACGATCAGEAGRRAGGVQMPDPDAVVSAAGRLCA